MKFKPLAPSLTGRYESNLADLPDEIADMVRAELFGGVWDDLSSVQRQHAIEERDYQNDPKNQDELEDVFESYLELRDREKSIDHEILKWDGAETSAVTELAQKEERLATLRLEKEKVSNALQSFGAGGDEPDGSTTKTDFNLGSAEWRSQNASHAAKTRHNREGGYAHLRQQAITAYQSGKYATKIACANALAPELNVSVSTVQGYLRNIPNPRAS